MKRALPVLAAAIVASVASVQVVRMQADARRSEAAAEEAPALRRAAVLSDSPQPSPGSSNASVRKAADGHFWAEAQVQGRHVRFLVDTGASTVALTASDARRLGLDLRDLTFDQPVSTASGKTMGAAVTLDYVSVSGARVDKVEALVLQQGLETSLLGMTYLGRLSRFEASRDSLILRR